VMSITSTPGIGGSGASGSGGRPGKTVMSWSARSAASPSGERSTYAPQSPSMDHHHRDVFGIARAG
jgi:hypothetical protein